MKQIIRIEHPEDGKGLWRSMLLWESRIDRHPNYSEISNRHCNMPPANFDDELSGISPSEYCAFNSIESFQEWIDSEWIDGILQLGFQILLLSVSKCRQSKYQTLYRKEDIISQEIVSSLFIKS